MNLWDPAGCRGKGIPQLLKTRKMRAFCLNNEADAENITCSSAEPAEGKWGRGGLSQKHEPEAPDPRWLPWCRALVSPIHGALDRVDSWTGPGVAQVEGQMEIGLTDTLGM